jgi:ankyrin repeat protein
VEAIKVLAQLGADKDAKTAKEATALHYAVLHGHMEAIRVLVVQLVFNKEAKDAKDAATPLHYAATKGHVEAMKVLVVQMGVNKEAKTVDG